MKRKSSARPAETYRGARRNAAHAFNDVWGPPHYSGRHKAVYRDYRWSTGVARRPGKPTWDKPHQGERERARRVRQMAEGNLKP